MESVNLCQLEIKDDDCTYFSLHTNDSSSRFQIQQKTPPLTLTLHYPPPSLLELPLSQLSVSAW